MVADAADGPSRSLEIELKFDADDATPLPGWTGVPGVALVDPGEVRELDAQYYDTADFALAAGGFALRRRTGGPDEGWHVKGPRVGAARVEYGWPLGDGAEVPDEVRSAVTHLTSAPLTPLARIRSIRTAFALRDASGGLVAEFVDDRVSATALRAGAQREWREWEIELGPAGPADDAGRAEFFAAAADRVAAAGGRPPTSASKLARALGY